MTFFLLILIIFSADIASMSLFIFTRGDRLHGILGFVFGYVGIVYFLALLVK